MTYSGPGQTERVATGATAYVNDRLGLGSETTAGSTIHYTRAPDGEAIGQRTPAGRYYYLRMRSVAPSAWSMPRS